MTAVAGIDEPLIMERSGQSFFYHADGLGSITDITNQSGTVVQRYAYSSFGKIESQSNPTFVQPYTFTSREWDGEVTVYYYRARTYDSFTGRFLQEDPILGFASFPLSLNKFPYVLQNPTNSVDPSGAIAPIVAAAGAVVIIQTLTIGSVYAITAGIVAVTSALSCDRSPIRRADLNRAFAYAYGASIAPAVQTAVIAGTYLATQAVATYAFLNPVATYEFVKNLLSPGPPQPGITYAPYIGTAIEQAVEYISGVFGFNE